ncbi:flagellar biosynthesis anti-sigma factor FlgM [Gorillibacterium massiliense]|uniref:flagellar biosynthesis anti-sigma factor FlgM n=1 Tax=Gorillibacterium massiliense TaxID=1280390 RepID=UPI0004B8F25E|nr:flagellar biosynthesis anti-sigma factor FlgM [Gorillibacterium massiliense]
MKINEPSRIGNVNPYNRQQEMKTAQSDKARTKRKDEVQISSEAKELQEAVSGGQLVDDARKEKLESLKQSVSTGTYQVEAGKIAEKLLPYLK